MCNCKKQGAECSLGEEKVQMRIALFLNGQRVHLGVTHISSVTVI